MDRDRGGDPRAPRCGRTAPRVSAVPSRTVVHDRRHASVRPPPKHGACRFSSSAHLVPLARGGRAIRNRCRRSSGPTTSSASSPRPRSALAFATGALLAFRERTRSFHPFRRAPADLPPSSASRRRARDPPRAASRPHDGRSPTRSRGCSPRRGRTRASRSGRPRAGARERHAAPRPRADSSARRSLVPRVRRLARRGAESARRGRADRRGGNRRRTHHDRPSREGPRVPGRRARGPDGESDTGESVARSIADRGLGACRSPMCARSSASTRRRRWSASARKRTGALLARPEPATFCRASRRRRAARLARDAEPDRLSAARPLADPGDHRPPGSPSSAAIARSGRERQPPCASVSPGLHRPDVGWHTVVWWTLPLRLAVQETVLASRLSSRRRDGERPRRRARALEWQEARDRSASEARHRRSPSPRPPTSPRKKGSGVFSGGQGAGLTDKRLPTPFSAVEIGAHRTSGDREQALRHARARAARGRRPRAPREAVARP